MTISVIDRVEPMTDALGWVVFFDNSAHQQKIPSKYGVEPHRGDEIKLEGFPHTSSVKINENLVFEIKSEAYYSEIYQSSKKVRELESLLDSLRMDLCKN